MIVNSFLRNLNKIGISNIAESEGRGGGGICPESSRRKLEENV